MVKTSILLTFLKELSENNNREWFHAHTQERKEAILEFEILIEELELTIMKFDQSISFYPSKELTFKQVRDTRFSKDKSPYNPSFRAHIAPKGKLPIPVGYYICIKPNNESFIGGGLFTDMFSNATNMVREYLSKHANEFNRIISADEFRENFVIYGTKLKNVPKQFDSSLSISEYLKHKSWFLECKISDEDILTNDNLINDIAEKFERMKDFNNYLNKALIDFNMPRH